MLYFLGIVFSNLLWFNLFEEWLLSFWQPLWFLCSINLKELRSCPVFFINYSIKENFLSSKALKCVEIKNIYWFSIKLIPSHLSMFDSFLVTGFFLHQRSSASIFSFDLTRVHFSLNSSTYFRSLLDFCDVWYWLIPIPFLNIYVPLGADSTMPITNCCWKLTNRF